MSALRPLPPRPSLEFERKEAKALLRRLRAGEPEAIERARERHPAISATTPERIRLADAQLAIAREYGFTSWPRLVAYFGGVARQEQGFRSREPYRRDFYDGQVRSLLVEHRDRRTWTARALGSYVPRFYGMGIDEVFASSVSEDDARLVVARMSGFPSWSALVERAATARRYSEDGWEPHPLELAHRAMLASDIDALQQIVSEHPALLRPSNYEVTFGSTLIGSALRLELERGVETMRPIFRWLTSQGLDFQQELNVRLCGQMYMTTESVRFLLDRGADPNWIAPNGFSVLEHALIRYWNGEAVDLLAERAIPRKALWIAAGLGDVGGVRSFLDASGRPKREVRKCRPDFDAVGQRGIAAHPDPDDEELLMEAFLVAMFNGRTEVLSYMASRGFNVNSLAWGSPLINMAVGNAWTAVVACLIRAGADLDLRGWRPQQTAREAARGMFEHNPRDERRRRIVELCGMDPDAILAERDARPVDPPGFALKLREALELAGEDAFRRGQADIRPENLLFGLLRGGGLALTFFTKVSKIDFERFRADVWERVRPDLERAERPALALNAEAQAAMSSAIAAATERRGETVTTPHLLHALLQDANGAAAQLLARYGSSAAKLKAQMEDAL